MKKKIAIVGGGSCALMLGCELNTQKFDVSIYENNAALGRKFLVAGAGGLNLTHSEKHIDFIKRYTPFSFLEKAFSHFSNNDLIKWINDVGVETFIGTSGRVFPKKGIKPAAVLNIILKKIKDNQVKVHIKHNWRGFSKNNNLLFEHNNTLFEIESDYVIFCLGGASWQITGSKGDWVNYFTEKNIEALPFKASNCAFKIDWPLQLINKIEGGILKNISITCKDKTHFGEIVITKFGIEGSGIYPLSPQITEQLTEKKSAEISIDFKPGFSIEKIIEKLSQERHKKNLTDILKTELNFSQPQVQLLKSGLNKESFLNVAKLAFAIKHFELKIIGSASIDEAISTTGGISLIETDEDFQLKKLPRHFVIGEMLDYDAPTGGYLLQSCFSMAKFVAYNLNNKIT